MFYQMGRTAYYCGEPFDPNANAQWCDGWLDAANEDDGGIK